MKKILIMLFVIIAAHNCLKAQLKFSLTPDKIFTGNSELISNCVGYSEYYDFLNFDYTNSEPEYVIKGNKSTGSKSWREKQNRKYILKYGLNFKNFYIEDIETSRKIVLIKPNGEIMKDFDHVIITSTEKIIGFSKNYEYHFFDLQTGRMLPEFIEDVHFFSQDKYAIVEGEKVYNNKTSKYERNSFIFDIPYSHTPVSLKNLVRTIQ